MTTTTNTTAPAVLTPAEAILCERFTAEALRQLGGAADHPTYGAAWQPIVTAIRAMATELHHAREARSRAARDTDEAMRHVIARTVEDGGCRDGKRAFLQPLASLGLVDPADDEVEDIFFRDYAVEVTRTGTVTVRAMDEDDATELAEDCGVEDWHDEVTDVREVS